ncbi:cobalamin B12-binding domain-containing protein [Dethiobacter alkaliphilus]|uniref:cobalamin B12-binding domain-containing protein n=1 Tax=Dethiobacter alkaliphilus TaxID=427926 RepID=UPI0022271D61|nr:corrinoid protein [Dethiobacter alkaliphilus]MCW3490975.1 corrinoid protein [Dethiobacter alkaliphilus]
MNLIEKLSRAVETGDVEAANSLTLKALKNGLPPAVILNEGLMGGMEKVGEKFAAGDMFIPEVLIAGEALKTSVELIQPQLKVTDSFYKGKIVMATVAGDIHDLGKNLVSMNLTANGFEVIDLGVDVSGLEIVQAVKKHKPDFLGLSALLTTTMPEMTKTVQLLVANGLRDACKIIVGGAPVTAEFAREIAADFYAENTIEAVRLIKEECCTPKREDNSLDCLEVK